MIHLFECFNASLSCLGRLISLKSSVLKVGTSIQVHTTHKNTHTHKCTRACTHAPQIAIAQPCVPPNATACRYENTELRKAKVAEKGLLYLGMGVSGGEEGARRGE